MAVINILDSETIDKIAAGEVVERPASVVKELVENAVDSGADNITVEIRDGGISFIRVTDNGCGIDKEQVRNAFLRHATSKIKTAYDLNAIHSLGFRGEALSSIGAVAMVEMITKTADSLTGIRYQCDGAAEKDFSEVGAPDGTTVIVRNLFFNTPVRRKFLKSANTEGTYITDLMEHIALSRPDISFKLLIGSKLKFHTSGNGNLKEVIYRIYGKEVSDNVMEVKAEKSGISMTGYLGKPVLNRSNRNYETYFINGRYIRSALLARAIEDGYSQYLMQHKFPFVVLHFEVDSMIVDVNVHPTKMDVRFASGNEIFNFVQEAVLQALHHREMIPTAISDEGRGSAKSVPSVSNAPKTQISEPVASVPVQKPAPAEPERIATIPEAVSVPESFARAGSTKIKLAEPVKNQVSESVEYHADAVQNGADSAENDAESQKMQEILHFEEPQGDSFFVETGKDATIDAVSADREEPLETSPDNTSEPIEPDFSKSEQLNLFEERILQESNRPQYKIVGQVFDTYWIIEFQDKMLLIDQHAAHEKVKFERLVKHFREKDTVSQMLNPPIILTFTGKEASVYEEYASVFAGLGFEVEHFGGNEYALRGVPEDLYGCDERTLFTEVLDELSEGPMIRDLTVIHDKLASMACKSAVKGNHALSLSEAEALIDELLTLENPYNCPHGRPTIISMTKYEIEKKFKRIV